MEKEIRGGGSKTIPLEEVRILCDTSGTEIAALQPGRGDYGHLWTPLVLKSHISNVLMNLLPDESLLRIPQWDG